MNTGSVNSNAINASTINYVIGALTAIAVTFAGNTEASAMVYGGNTGAVTVTVNSSSGQYRRANMVTGGAVISGTSSTIRYANYVPKYAPLDVTGTTKAYLRAYGGNSGTVSSTGTIAPNYYVEPDYTQDGTINVTIEAKANNRKIGRAFGGIPFSGLFVVPRIVPAYDIDTVIEFNGRCLAVDKIGYGNPGNINITVNTEGVRTTVCAAAGNIYVTLGSLVTNYIGVGKSSGSISVTGLVNVAIKHKNDHYYTQYYEDWLKWNIGSLDIEPLVYKIGTSNSDLVDRDIKVGMVSTATTKARGFINDGAILSTVASVDYGRIAGSRNSIGSITITGYPVSYSIKKPSAVNNYVTVSGSGYGVRRTTGDNSGTIAVVGTGYANNIVKTTIAQGSAYITGTTVGIRRVVAASTGNCTINGELVVKVYKKSYGTTNMVISGSCIGSVKTTVNDCIITTSGFAKGIRNTLASAYGSISVVVEATDIRLAVRGENEGSVDVTAGNRDFRLAVRLDSRTSLDITGRTDAITNLYTNADETRQMSVPASDWANGEYLHYMEVQA